MNKLTLTAAVTALGLMLTGCTSITDSAESDLIKHLRGEVVSSVETTLDADSVKFFSDYTDEELVALADRTCAFVAETIEGKGDSEATDSEALTAGIIALISNPPAPSNEENVPQEEALAAALLPISELVISIEPVTTIYCTTHKEAVVTTLAFLESTASQPIDENDPELAELTQLAQLNADLQSFIAIAVDAAGILVPGAAVVFGEEGRTVNIYVDQNGDNVINESELVDTFTAPAGYLVTYEATGEYVLGEAYGVDAKVAAASLAVVKE